MSHNMIAVVNHRFVEKKLRPFWRPSRGLPKNIALHDGRHDGLCVRDYKLQI